LRAAVLFVPWVAVLRRLIGTPAASSSLGPASAAHGTLKAGAGLFGYARARRRLHFARRRRSGSLVEFLVSLGLGVFIPGFWRVLFSTLFPVNFSVFIPGLWRRLRGQRFIMHFVGDGVGFLCRVLVVGIQRLLQLFEFGGLYKGFGHCFDCFPPFFGTGLRFFVLGLGELFGKRGYIFLR
jgi:hypothetical protein